MRVSPSLSCYCCADIVKTVKGCHPPCEYVLCEVCADKIYREFENTCPACRQQRPVVHVSRPVPWKLLSMYLICELIICMFGMAGAYFCIRLWSAAFDLGMACVSLLFTVALLCVVCYIQRVVILFIRDYPEYKCCVEMRYFCYGRRTYIFDRRSAGGNTGPPIEVWDEAGREEIRRPENQGRP